MTRFAGWIERVPEAAHPVLVPWLDPLSRLFGPLPAGAPSSEGDPDGYDGLDRRGPLDRLLMSEWALLQENPDEFIRRFSMREVAYLHPRRTAPRSQRWSVVVFDAGPAMLGFPRLVHVALMLVLAERAERAGATLAVGTLQSEATLVPFDLDADRVRLMLGRSSQRAVHGDAQRWRAAVPPGGELVVVGPGGASVSEEEGGVVVGWEHRRVRLPLPPVPAALAAMRDLEEPVEKPKRSRPAAARAPAAGELLHRSVPGTLFFAPDGRRLIVREPEVEFDNFVAYHVPDSAKSLPGKPISLRSPVGAYAAAIGWRGKQFMAIWERSGHALEGQMVRAPDLPLRGVRVGSPVPRVLYRGSDVGFMMLFDGDVWTWVDARPRRFDTGVLAINQSFVRVKDHDGFLWRRTDRQATDQRLGPAAPWALGEDVVFWSVERQRWLGGPELAEIGDDPSWRLLGVGPRPASAWFVVDGSMVVLQEAGEATPRVAWEVGGEVIEAAVSDRGERVAVRTDANQILVYSERFREFVTRLGPADDTLVIRG